MSYSSIFRFIACLKRNEIFTIGNLQVLTNLLDSYPTLTISFLYLTSTGMSYSIPIFELNIEVTKYYARRIFHIIKIF